MENQSADGSHERDRAAARAPVTPQTIRDQRPERTFLVENDETGIPELWSEGDLEKNRKFNETLAAAGPPVITVGLIGINVAAFLVAVLYGISPFQPAPDAMLGWGANYGPLTTHGEWWRLVTAAFLHFGAMHLLSNMFCLLMIGPFAERVFGHVRFTAIYMFTGIVGNPSGLFRHPLGISGGASGAIFGICGALFGFIALQRDVMPGRRVGSIAKRAAIFVALNLLGLAQPGVDAVAHVGGFISGLVLGGAFTGAMLLWNSGTRRWLTAAATLAAAGVGGYAVVRAPVVDDYRAEIQRLIALEKTVTRIYADSLAKLRAHQMATPEFAHVAEAQILAPWKMEGERFARLRLPRGERELANQIGKYIRLRAESWTLVEEGILAGNVVAVREANEKNAEAMAVMAAIAAKNLGRQSSNRQPAFPTTPDQLQLWLRDAETRGFRDTR